MSISWMKIWYNQKDESGLFALYEIDLCFCRIISCYLRADFHGTMTNLYPCSSLKNPHILCHQLNEEDLPCYQDRGVLMATGIGKLWQNVNNGSAICMSNVWDLFENDLALWLPCFRGNYLWCFWFDALFYTHQLPCMIACWKIRFVNISISLLFLIQSFASGSSKTRRVSQKLYNPLD